jgi:hypothetical protein
MEISGTQIEDIILSHGTRGMDQMRHAIPGLLLWPRS